MKPYYEDAKSGIVIYHGDCREILPTLPPADLLLTDPPYGIGEGRATKISSRGGLTKFHGRKSIFVKSSDFGDSTWDRQRIDDELLKAVCGAAEWQIIWGGNYYAAKLAPGPCWLVWDKDNNGDFADAELAWTNLRKAVRMIKFRWNGMIQQDMKNKEVRVHPTQKPVPVMAWAIGHAPAECKTIIDPFMGSGTTLVAAKSLGRQCIGIEREERYAEIAAKRLQQEYLPLNEPAPTPPEAQAQLGQEKGLALNLKIEL